MSEPGLPHIADVAPVVGQRLDSHPASGDPAGQVREPLVKPLRDGDATVVRPVARVDGRELLGAGVLGFLAGAVAGADLLLALAGLGVDASVHCVRPGAVGLAAALDAFAVVVAALAAL